MQDDQLLQRADKAIAESKRLTDELHKSMLRAKQLDDRLNHLHWLRIEESRTKK
jgi:hypothetical protein